MTSSPSRNRSDAELAIDAAYRCSQPLESAVRSRKRVCAIVTPTASGSSFADKVPREDAEMRAHPRTQDPCADAGGFKQSPGLPQRKVVSVRKPTDCFRAVMTTSRSLTNLGELRGVLTDRMD